MYEEDTVFKTLFPHFLCARWYLGYYVRASRVAHEWCWMKFPFLHFKTLVVLEAFMAVAYVWLVVWRVSLACPAMVFHLGRMYVRYSGCANARALRLRGGTHR